VNGFNLLRKWKRRLVTHLITHQMWPPPGHFYSPLVDYRQLGQQAESLFDRRRASFPGIELNEAAQCSLLMKMAQFYNEQPFPEDKSGHSRYYLRNGYYSYADGLMLHMMMRQFQPKRIIEIGSGFSSALMLDTNERFFENRIDLTFVEPNPERLYSLMKPDDESRVTVVTKLVQDIDSSCFSELAAGDMLFIDSSHVSKTGGDVNHLYLEVLPLLNPGVLVQIHDVFEGFEYPKEWVCSDQSYFGFNEMYLLRAFLMFNDAFEIVMFTPWMEQHHREWFELRMPLFLKDTGGNIWIRRKEQPSFVKALLA